MACYSSAHCSKAYKNSLRNKKCLLIDAGIFYVRGVLLLIA
jgi:hypothetical protein